MLVELSVDNLAIIQRARIEFGPGFSVFTGETGAGKSLVVDALNLVMGGRADTTLVRKGASSAVVQAVFDLSASPALVVACEQLGVPLEESLLYVQREVMAEGKSQCRIGGRLTPVSTLKQIAGQLIALHGQHDHEALLDPDNHLSFYDNWIGAEAFALLEDASAAHERLNRSRQTLASIRSGAQEREQRIDMLRFQIEEIEAVGPVAGEMQGLTQRLARLQNVEKLVSAIDVARQAITEQEGSADELVGVAAKSLEGIVNLDSRVGEILGSLQTARVYLETALQELNVYTDELDADPAELEVHAARLDALKRLSRKYGATDKEILEFLDGAREELSFIEQGAVNEEEAANDLEIALAQLTQVSGQLTELRESKCAAFASDMLGHLSALNLASAQFEVSISACEPGPTGADKLQFLFCANVGELLAPLHKVASGGELSRLMLALKSLSGPDQGPATLIFDEVDSGLSGRAASATAAKLRQLGETRQVIAITHLPQVAAKATSHYLIAKEERDGRTQTFVEPLKLQEREKELARLLAGDETSEKALENARDLLMC